MTPPELDRRSLLRLAGGLVGGALVAAGCGITSDGGDGGGSGDGAQGDGGQGDGGPDAPALRPAEPWTPLPEEPVPNAKKLAADFVQALTSTDGSVSATQVLAAAATFTGAGFDPPAAAKVAAPLFDGRASEGDIVYPQLGGLVPLSEAATSASVMVVVRQRRLSDDGDVEAVVRVCDVRLEVQGEVWRVVELASAGGEPVARPDDLPPVTAAVLDDPRIELPDTCRWDIHARVIDPEVLGVLQAAAAQAPVAVTVLKTGHPVNVFGTSNVSNHTDGRAVDIWRIDGTPVVTTPAAAGATGVVLRTAFADGRVSQTGSPPGSDQDGGGRRSFVNIVHEDHLHLAVGTGSRE